MSILSKEDNIMNMEVQNLLTNYWNGLIPVDVFSIAKLLGISICYETLDKDICSLLNKNNNAINLLVNEELTPLKKRFVIAHNIGHYILHLKNELNEFIDGVAIFKFNIGKESKEYEANKFATNLLIPKDNLKYELSILKNERLPDIFTISYLSTKFDVPSFIMDEKLDEASFIEDLQPDTDYIFQKMIN